MLCTLQNTAYANFSCSSSYFCIARICVDVTGNAVFAAYDEQGDEFNLLFFIHVKDFFLK